MPVTGSSVTVTTSATVLGTPKHSRTEMIVSVPANGVIVYVGGPAVTTTTGFTVYPGERVVFSTSETTRSGSAEWYGVIATGTQAVAVVEVS